MLVRPGPKPRRHSPPLAETFGRFRGAPTFFWLSSHFLWQGAMEGIEVEQAGVIWIVERNPEWELREVFDKRDFDEKLDYIAMYEQYEKLPEPARLPPAVIDLE